MIAPWTSLMERLAISLATMDSTSRSALACALNMAWMCLANFARRRGREASDLPSHGRAPTTSPSSPAEKDCLRWSLKGAGSVPLV